jgi:Ulp1 family protease
MVCLSTAFMTQLVNRSSTNTFQYNFENVSRWKFKKLLDNDKVFIPLNISNVHWVLIVISKDTQVIEFYDSMPQVCTDALRYMNYTVKFLRDLGTYN